AGTAAAALRGRAAVANGRAAYAAWGELFSGPRWERLAAHGARPQRPLWASTSTKNPAYPDTLYVDQLIGPGTVNTMPDDTLAAFADHGTLERTLDADPAGAFDVLRRLGDVGVDMAEVADVLEAQGVSSFVKSYEELLESLRTKAAELA
ncbi:MAG TPA: transaldolase, partial [Acidimicrobiaceae bacterium]|nr:transaldolase [Acidimicrobiaceae bacterium]